MEVFAHLNPGMQRVEIWFRPNSNSHNLSMKLTGRGEWETEAHEFGAQVEPSLRIPEEFVNGLITALSSLNLPAGATYNQGELARMKDHLKDMRHLVFKGNGPK